MPRAVATRFEIRGLGGECTPARRAFPGSIPRLSAVRRSASAPASTPSASRGRGAAVVPSSSALKAPGRSVRVGSSVTQSGSRMMRSPMRRLHGDAPRTRRSPSSGWPTSSWSNTVVAVGARRTRTLPGRTAVAVWATGDSGEVLASGGQQKRARCPSASVTSASWGRVTVTALRPVSTAAQLHRQRTLVQPAGGSPRACSSEGDSGKRGAENEGRVRLAIPSRFASTGRSRPSPDNSWPSRRTAVPSCNEASRATTCPAARRHSDSARRSK